MKSLSLSTLAELAGAELIAGNGERVATGVGIDSRTIQPGELFVAIRGESMMGMRMYWKRRRKVRLRLSLKNL